jgi:hypothetical protein
VSRTGDLDSLGPENLQTDASGGWPEREFRDIVDADERPRRPMDPQKGMTMTVAALVALTKMA